MALHVLLQLCPEEPGESNNALSLLGDDIRQMRGTLPHLKAWEKIPHGGASDLHLTTSEARNLLGEAKKFLETPKEEKACEEVLRNIVVPFLEREVPMRES